MSQTAQTNTIGATNNSGSTTANQSTTGNSATNQSTLGTSLGTTANATAGQTSATANPAIASAALGNLNSVQQLQANGFQGYTGQQVANLSPGQQGTINTATGIANNGTGQTATGMIDNYAGAPAQQVGTNTISSQMSPYMNQYVMQALAPQLQQMNNANAATNQATDAMATGSGAFGDARTGIQQANNAFNQNVQREGVIGNAYNSAFNTAIGAGAQDVANQNSTQATNANLAETALGRSLGGANALEGLQTQQMGTQGAANALNAQNTATSQANLTAQYNQWLMAQQYPFQTAGLVNSTIGQAASAMPATTNTVGTSAGQNTGNTSNTGTSNTNSASNSAATGTSQSTGTSSGVSSTQQPNNSGLALAGSLFGALV
jgi:hypothetical protein